MGDCETRPILPNLHKTRLISQSFMPSSQCALYELYAKSKNRQGNPWRFLNKIESEDYFISYVMVTFEVVLFSPVGI